MNIKLLALQDFQPNKEIPLKLWTFPSGEVGVKILDQNGGLKHGVDTNFVIVCRAQNSNDIIAAALVQDALKRHINNREIKINLFLPKVPYAQQDRICDDGESFSIKVFANYINSLKFDNVIILDPHSDVTPALINNLTVISQFDIIKKWEHFKQRVLQGNNVFIAPDAGSNKKIAKLAGYFNYKEFVRADKLRDLTNGNIIETIVYCDDFKGKDVICCDDICLGGRTFIELAKVCKARNCGKFILYITHGVFSVGTKLENIDEIWTTNSFHEKIENVELFNIETLI